MLFRSKKSCKNKFKSFLIGVGTMLSSWKGVCLSRVDWGEEKMLESPPNLGLRTIYIVPLHGMTNFTIRVRV